jgi:sugar-specific transcriptional regulator TrmB
MKALNILGFQYIIRNYFNCKRVKFGVKMEKIEELLRDFGLTEYEIKAFVTLLKLKVATAEQISEVGNIPLPRVYDTLSELKNKGFVLISKTRPKRFKSTSPEKALENLIKIKRYNFDNNIKYLENNIKKIKNVVSEIEPVEFLESSDNFWSIEKRRNILEVLDEQKEMAQNEILMFSGDLSWLKETSKSFKNSIRKGVKIRVIAHEPEGEDNLKNIKLAKKIGIDVRIGYKGLMRGHVIDNKIASIAIKQTPKGVNIGGKGQPGSDSLNKYELITIDNPVLVNTLKENFEFWWKSLR